VKNSGGRGWRGIRVLPLPKALILTALLVTAACAGPRLPPPNSAVAAYDAQGRAIQVMVSSLQPTSAATLVRQDGTRYPAYGFSVISQPHVLYNPPPSIGFGIGGFGISGCCTGIGSGVGVGMPVGGPTVAEASDQFVTSARIAAPADYSANWAQYHVEVSAGNQSMSLAAPPPST
jgi:hypothetical protein